MYPMETRIRVVEEDETFYIEIRDAEDRLLLQYYPRHDEALDLALDILYELYYYYEDVGSDELAFRIRRALCSLGRMECGEASK